MDLLHCCSPFELDVSILFNFLCKRDIWISRLVTELTFSERLWPRVRWKSSSISFREDLMYAAWSQPVKHLFIVAFWIALIQMLLGFFLKLSISTWTREMSLAGHHWRSLKLQRGTVFLFFASSLITRSDQNLTWGSDNSRMLYQDLRTKDVSLALCAIVDGKSESSCNKYGVNPNFCSCKLHNLLLLLK